MKFSFNLTKQNSGARAGEIQTARGLIKTPVFMPVGTLATVKSLNQTDLNKLGAQIILGNTYHLFLRPGLEVFKSFNGLHKFMNWQKPILTDSGGFQIFSLPRARTISEEGAVFQSYVDGLSHTISPEKSIQIQNTIGSDIMMVLDECINSTADESRTREAMELTYCWALRSLNEYKKLLIYDQDQGKPYQALFGIVQGGVFKNLRKQSAEFLTQHEFSGFSIGGLAVGESKRQREEMTEVVTELLPVNKPRYLMGVGTPIDLLEAIRRGVDMFDCIIPTKMAQQGNAYTSGGLVKLTHSNYKFSDEPLDSKCGCSTCATYSRSYLQHLTKCREVLGWHLISYHNLYYYHRLMEAAREAILKERFMEFYSKTLSGWASGEGLGQGSLTVRGAETSERLLGREEAALNHVKKKNRGLLVSEMTLENS